MNVVWIRLQFTFYGYIQALVERWDVCLSRYIDMEACLMALRNSSFCPVNKASR